MSNLKDRPYNETMRSESVLLQYLHDGETISFLKNGTITITTWDYSQQRPKLIMLWTDYMECMTWLVDRKQNDT